MNKAASCIFLLVFSLTFAAPADDFSALEIDWLRQLDTRLDPAKQKKAAAPKRNPVDTQADAAGGVDGITDGKWGFHTAREKNPWWQVDLEAPVAVDRIVVYNRCDGTAGRNARILVLFSTDGKNWRRFYRHDGSVFLGFSDKKPLVVDGEKTRTRYVRLQLEKTEYFHLDEVAVYAADVPKKNIALGKPADQSSTSRWSTGKKTPTAAPAVAAGAFAAGAREVIRRGRLLAADLANRGVDCGDFRKAAASIETKLAGGGSPDRQRALYFDACRAVRTLSFRNPLLDFDRIIVTRRVHGSFSHMSDQYLGWWSRPGGGIYVMEDFTSDAPTLTCLTKDFPAGSFLRPSLSYDGTKILFAWCRYYPHVAKLRDKVDKDNLPEDSFYQVFEMNVDGTGLRQLTRGKYNSFDARYLPGGRIVFLSTRRAQFLQCGRQTALRTCEETSLPESYVRCGGGPSRPCAVYTLHTISGDGTDMINISGFEMFEWTPAVSNDGTIMFARWDYVDRHNNAFMSLWECNPDGTNPRHLYGNYTTNPHCIFEARAIPGSRKLVATASAHHSVTAGSLILIDPARGLDGEKPLTRLTPETCFPEMEGWPGSWYVNPWPLSENYFLTGWSHKPLGKQGGRIPPDCVGVYLYDAFGNLTLLYRDETMSTMFPLPVAARERPREIPDNVAWDGPQQGTFMLSDIYVGVLKDMPRGSIKRLRLVAVPPKTQPTMNRPHIGMKKDDPGKVVLGTVPVEKDGSAYFHAPSGITIFFQALDAAGLTVQTMRTGTYVHPGKTLACVGCHESKYETTPRAEGKVSIASRRPPSKLTPGPPGSWPLRYDTLVQPILDKKCVRCHDGKKGKGKPSLNFAGVKHSYPALTRYGKVSLQGMIREQLRINHPETKIYEYMSKRSSLLAHLKSGHKKVALTPEDLERFVTWMDTYAQLAGHFSEDQARRLTAMRKRHANIIAE